MPVLTPLRRGILYFCLHVLTQVALLALSKNLFDRYNFGEVLFLRLLPAWLFIMTLAFVRPHFRPWHSKRKDLHLLRGFLGFINMISLYAAVKLLPLSLAMTIRQLEAFLWVGLAAYLYKEKVTNRQWLALVIGLSGVLLVLRPSFAANALGASIALVCAASGAYVRVLSRELSRTENSNTIVFFNFSQWTLLTLFITPTEWTMPQGGDWVPLVATGAVVLVSQWFMTEGMALAPAARLAPFRHMEIFWSGLLGWLLWKETIGGWFLMGSVLIIAGGILANWHSKTTVLPEVE